MPSTSRRRDAAVAHRPSAQEHDHEQPLASASTTRSDPRRAGEPEARIAGDVVEIDSHTWAIHAVIPVDGDVIIGEFEIPQAAHAVLEQLAVTDETTINWGVRRRR